MLALRIIGGLAALGFLGLSVRRWHQRKISRLSLIIGALIALVLFILAVAPSVFNPIFNTFDFGEGNNRRLIFALMAAVGLVFVLLLRLQSQADINEHSIRMLVEALGQERFDWERAAAVVPEGPLLVTVSPAYNEAENVAPVIASIPKTVEGYNVVSIVVSDGSEDDTAEIARKAGALVSQLPIRRGGGLALRVGYEIALKIGADIVVTLDADGQHLSSELPIMIGPIIRDEADYVNGSRLLGTFEKESAIRHIGVHFFSRLVTTLTGRRITDPSSGYRAARADLLRKLVLSEDQFWTTEVLIEALRHRARIAEVPVTIEARKGGKSKKPKSLKYGYYFSRTIFQTWLR